MNSPRIVTFSVCTGSDSALMKITVVGLSPCLSKNIVISDVANKCVTEESRLLSPKETKK